MFTEKNVLDWNLQGKKGEGKTENRQEREGGTDWRVFVAGQGRRSEFRSRQNS